MAEAEISISTPNRAHDICAHSDDDVFISLIVAVTVTFLIASDSLPYDLTYIYILNIRRHTKRQFYFKNTILRSE